MDTEVWMSTSAWNEERGSIELTSQSSAIYNLLVWRGGEIPGSDGSLCNIVILQMTQKPGYDKQRMPGKEFWV